MDMETWLTETAEAAAEAMGLALVAVETAPGLIRVFVDGDGGVSVGDCEALSRKLGEILDGADVLSGPYVLEVSSPGLDRVLKTDRERRWAVGKQVKAHLSDGRVLEGKLEAASAGEVILSGQKISLSRVAKLHLNEVR